MYDFDGSGLVLWCEMLEIVCGIFCLVGDWVNFFRDENMLEKFINKLFVKFDWDNDGIIM